MAPYYDYLSSFIKPNTLRTSGRGNRVLPALLSPSPPRLGVKAGNPVLEVCFEGRRQLVAGMEGGDKGGREEGEKDNRKLS